VSRQIRSWVVALLWLSGCHVVLPLDSPRYDRDAATVEDGASDGQVFDKIPIVGPDAGPDILARLDHAAVMDQRPSPDLSFPDLPTSDLPAPDLPTADTSPPDLPSPDLSTPDLPAPDTSPPDLTAPDKPQGPFTYLAQVAACTSPSSPSTSLCENDTGTNEMSVDLEDDSMGIPFQSYVSFQLDGKLAGMTVTKVTLELHTTNNSKATSDQTGEVWQVKAFTLSSLDQAVPQTQVILAPDGGTVKKNQPVTWDLPTSIAVANTTVYLGIVPISSSGVNYWNNDGSSPPKLIIQ